MADVFRPCYVSYSYSNVDRRMPRSFNEVIIKVTINEVIINAVFYALQKKHFINFYFLLVFVFLEILFFPLSQLKRLKRFKKKINEIDKNAFSDIF